MPPENPNNQVTRADLEHQLEVHAKTIELQLVISQQQEKILERLEVHAKEDERIIGLLETIEKRTWKQEWLFWGLIVLMLGTCVSVVIELLT